ncbi:MAG: hypothetical protein Q4B35_05340 [Slackia sp.]|nr:hypothetical protein [Slackia sp.]
MAFVSRFIANARIAAKEKPGVFGLYAVLSAIVAAVFVRSIFEGRYEYALLCLLVIVLFWVPSALERKLCIEIPSVLEAIILFFIFAAEILGEIDAFYIKIPFWDTMLHTTWGFLAAGIGFALADILNRSQATRLQLTPIYMAITAFCFSMTAGAIWELFEYTMDSLVGFDMQKDTIVAAFNSVTLDPTGTNVAIPVHDIVSTQIATASGETVTIDGYLDIGLHDSMADLFVNLIGAVTFSVIGFIYVKNRNRGNKKSFARHFIPKLRTK